MYPVAFSLFGLQITSYGILVALSFAYVWWRVSIEGPRTGISGEFLQNLLLVVLVSALTGARILHVLTHLEWYRQQPMEAIFSRSGYDFVGGFITAALATAWWCGRCKVEPGEVGDLIAPHLAFAHGIGRIGCFLFGCCYGTVCELPWAIHFPDGSDAFDFHGSVGVHPVQLYELASLWCIGGILLLIRSRKRFTWQVFESYIVLYGAARIVLELFRGDNRGALGFEWLSPSQILYGVLVLGALAAMTWQWRGATAARSGK